MAFQKYRMFAYFLQYLAFAAGNGHYQECKAVPGSVTWPTEIRWQKLNQTISGRLIKPIPPGGVCHPSYPTFNPFKCPTVASDWRENIFHAADPVSNTQNFWNNHTCLPVPTFPCSGNGYPVYVINATKPEHGTGHDYLGRSVAPNSLSIWTRHMTGFKFHKEGKFRPKKCRFAKVNTAAITVAAGVPMIEIDEFANKRNLIIVSGGAATVGIGGYTTGGGHGALSSTYGMAADQVLEIQMVTPGGEIITANECQNEDLFWAMRGGGGSTFGVITSITIKAYPSSKFSQATATFLTPIRQIEPYYAALTTILSHFPSLTHQGISGYTFFAPSLTNTSRLGFELPFPANIFVGVFFLPNLSPQNTTEKLVTAIKSVFAEAQEGFSKEVQVYSSVTGAEYPNFYDYYKNNNGPQDGGSNSFIGSRLLDGKALTGDREKLRKAMKGIGEAGIASGLLVSGPGVHNTKHIPGGGNAVNPAWRKAYLHLVTGTSFPPLAPHSVIAAAAKKNTAYIDHLRRLAPDSGAYINEADPFEPNHQQSFWGKNYKRLLKIKRKWDPEHVFWCRVCVGGEGWREVGGRVCRV